MAIPSSGALDFLNMARECAYGTWGSGSITGAISIRDLVAGGNTYGSGQSYPSINTSSSSYPPNTTPVQTNSFYGYDKDASSITAFSGSFGGGSGKAVCGSATNVTYYHDGSGTYPSVGDNCYTNSAGTSPMADNYYKMANGGLLYVEDEQASSIATC
jgi:hypothetical protein